eukprot:m.22250 g.22250  ORF g.22250 m.22250 type:complete len:131 (-) comp13750_c0_seq1:281-673(-)
MSAKNDGGDGAAAPEIDEEFDDEEKKDTGPTKVTASNVASEADKVTDFVEEKDAKVDENALKQAMDQIGETAKKDAAAREARRVELAAIVIDKADVKLISSEMEIDASEAETQLREHNGDAVAALRALLV